MQIFLDKIKKTRNRKPRNGKPRKTRDYCNYFHYMGGFTTPNCYEVVNWIIMREPLKVSESFVSTLFM